MKRRLIPLLLLTLLPLGRAEAQEARTLFVQMPDSILPLLTAGNRADCIDFLDNHMRAQVTNRFGTHSEMTQLTPDYVAISMTARSTWQMKVLPADTTQVICTVATACGTACDSRIRFYSAAWKELPTEQFLPAPPRMEDFLMPKPDSVDTYRYRDAVQRADMSLVRISLSPDNRTLTFIFDTPAYLEKEAADELKPFIRRALIYDWKEGKFTPRHP